MKATFENSVNVLLQAYLKDELRHGDCAACAVGNLINAKRKFSELDIRKLSDHEAGWNLVFCTMTTLGKKEQYIRPSNFKGEAKKQIEATGYNFEQLAKIEYAFETAPSGKSEDDWMFNGLMAVIDVLAEIHNIDLSVKEEYKNPFVKQYELLTNA